MVSIKSIKTVDDTCGNASNPCLERPRYYARQLVTASDLIQEQQFFLDKARRHNRMLHGWGVVCGLWVTPFDDEGVVCVEPGYALGPYGDEIVVEEAVKVDLFAVDSGGNARSACGEPRDMWCSDVRAALPAGQPVYIAIRYAECNTRPVEVPTLDCGDDTDCEYSRIRSSYVIKVLTELPETYQDPLPEPEIGSAVSCSRQADDPYRRACPPVPASPWIILAKIDRLPPNGALEAGDIDNVSLRRFVVSFAEYYFVCQQERVPGVAVPTRPAVIGVRPTDPQRLARRLYERVIDDEGRRIIESQFDDNPQAVGNLSIGHIRGVNRESPVVRVAEDMTISDLLAEGKANFLVRVLKAGVDRPVDDVAKEVDRIFTLADDANEVRRTFSGGALRF